MESDLFVLKAQWRTTLITKHRPPINSSIIIWNSNCIKGYFKKFFSDPEYYMFKYRGIDTYLDSEHPNEYNTLPTDWVYCRVWGYDDTVALEVEQEYLHKLPIQRSNGEMNSCYIIYQKE